MVKDAEANKEADKKKREGVDARNQADSIVFSTEKSLKEHGDKITADEKKNIESGISDLKEALKGTDVEEIKKKTQSLIQVSMKLGRQFTKVSRRLCQTITIKVINLDLTPNQKLTKKMLLMQILKT